jgi:hypothetical protein
LTASRDPELIQRGQQKRHGVGRPDIDEGRPTVLPDQVRGRQPRSHVAGVDGKDPVRMRR